MSAPTQDYLSQQVFSASPERLHLMVVDGAIRNARLAEKAIDGQNFEQAYDVLGKARDCVNELVGTIRPQPNPELAERLKGLFLFAFRELSFADFERSSERVRNALRVLDIHRQTWIELMSQQAEAVTSPTGIVPAPHGGTSWVV